MKFVPNAMTRAVGRTVLKTQKHSPVILFTAGVAGMVGTAVLASKATLQVEEIIDHNEETKEKAKNLLKEGRKDYSEADFKQDMVVLHSQTATKLVKLYGPALMLGIFSIACLTGSHVVLTRRNTALMASYTALEKSYKKYRERIAEEYGVDAERKLMFGKEEETTKDPKTGKDVKNEVLSSTDNSIYARFFDEYSRNWEKTPEYNLLFLRAQQAYANDLLRVRGHIFLNEVYDMLGIERSKAGAVVGWVISDEGDNFVDFGIFDTDRETSRNFVNGREGAILLDFNVDGVIYDKI